MLKFQQLFVTIIFNKYIPQQVILLKLSFNFSKINILPNSIFLKTFLVNHSF